METKQHAKLCGRRTALTKPISIRFTDEEVLELKNQSGKLSLSDFVRKRLFDNASSECTGAIELRLSPRSRQKLLAQILMRLGKLDVVHNVNDLLNGVQSGLIETSPEVCAKLEAVRGELNALRYDLLRALGLRP